MVVDPVEVHRILDELELTPPNPKVASVSSTSSSKANIQCHRPMVVSSHDSSTVSTSPNIDSASNSLSCKAKIQLTRPCVVSSHDSSKGSSSSNFDSGHIASTSKTNVQLQRPCVVSTNDSSKGSSSSNIDSGNNASTTKTNGQLISTKDSVNDDVVELLKRKKKLTCNVCKTSSDTPSQFQIHLQSKSHAKKVSSSSSAKNFQCCICNIILKADPYNEHMHAHLNLPYSSRQIDEDMKDYDLRCCEACDINHTSHETAKQHYKGKKHIWSTLEHSREVCGTRVWRTSNINEPYIFASTPRPYQVELFDKIMSVDGSSITYLPTGTGKTLVAVMVIKEMLKLNEKRFVFFITDRVLLLFQQCNYIRSELGPEFKVAAFAGEQYIDMPKSIYDVNKCNVLLFTAETFNNLIVKGDLKWGEASCIVFDEVHHCDKRHVYRQLVEDYHHQCKQEKKPKLLGLTASPTDKANYHEALNVLVDRLSEFDDAKLLAVTREGNDLKQYVYDKKIEMLSIEVSDEIQAIVDQIHNAADLFYEKGKSKFPNLDDRVKQLLSLTNEPEKWECLFVELEKLCEENPDEQSSPFLNFFTELIGLTTLLPILNRSDCIIKFRDVLVLKNKIPTFAKYKELDVIFKNLQAVQTPDESIYEKVISLTLDKVAEYKSRKKLLFSLLITRTRANAKVLTKLLNKDTRLSDKNIDVSSVIGHGSSKATKVGGMNVNQQKAALGEAKKEGNKIFVATSIVEEGIDIPSCGLLITLDPPANGTAFVQLKGRARQEESEFYIIVSSEKNQNILKKLYACENNMKNAVKHLCK